MWKTMISFNLRFNKQKYVNSDKFLMQAEI